MQTHLLPRWLARRVSFARRYFEPSALDVSLGSCPGCGSTVFVRLFRGDFGVRCIRCGAAANTVALVSAIKRIVGRLERASVLLSSRRGPLLDWARRSGAAVVTTTYNEEHPLGASIDGARNEDPQALTFADASFDLMLNQEIFEHVVDDARAFREARRVLRPGGYLAFTVPLDLAQPRTLERARVENGELIHLIEPEYHDEPSGGRVLAYRSYGRDIVERLLHAGFDAAWLDETQPALGHLSVGPPVVVARKAS